MAQDNGLLGIFLDGDNHLVVVVHGIVNALGGLLGHGDGREHLLDFLFHLVHVDVTHDDDGLQVRTIPLVVIVTQVLIGEVVNDIHRADGHAVFIFCPLIDDGQDIFLHALHGHSRTAGAPLLVDDAALLVNLLIFEQQVVAPVMQYQQAGVDDSLAHEGCRTDVIDRLVNRGVGIEVGTKLHADALTPGHDARFTVLAGEMLGAVKGHVLQEVGQPSLAGLLKDGTDTLCDVEVGKTGLLGIVPDVIGHAILEGTLSDARVLRQLGCRPQGQQHQCNK